MKVDLVKFRNQDACEFLFGRQFLKSQEMCLKSNSADPLDFLGDPVSLNNKIIGYQTTLPSCEPTYNCTQEYVFLSFIPFLDWISEHMKLARSSNE